MELLAVQRLNIMTFKLRMICQLKFGDLKRPVMKEIVSSNWPNENEGRFHSYNPSQYCELLSAYFTT